MYAKIVHFVPFFAKTHKLAQKKKVVITTTQLSLTLNLIP